MSGGDAPLALMRLMLAGDTAAGVIARLRAEAPSARRDAMLALAEDSRDGLRALERMVAAGADHAAMDSVAAARAMFDRLVALSPEGSVAAYSLGDPALLARATGEVVEWLRGLGLLAGRPRVLDLGCGIGRFLGALGAEAAFVVGVEVSEAMARAGAGGTSPCCGMRPSTSCWRWMCSRTSSRRGWRRGTSRRRRGCCGRGETWWC